MKRRTLRFATAPLLLTCLVILSIGQTPVADTRRSYTMALDTLEGLDIRAISNRGVDQVKVMSDVVT
jgi:hypothetical protein